MHITIVSAHNDAPPQLGVLDSLEWQKQNPVYVRKNLYIEGKRVIERLGDFETTAKLRFEPFDGELSDLYNRMQWRSTQALILARRIPKLDNPALRRAEEFKAVPQDVLSLDIDGMPFLDGFDRNDLLDDPQRVLEAHVDHLLFGHRVEWLAVLSSSCGFIAKDKPVLRFHLHVALDKAYPTHTLQMALDDMRKHYDFVDPATKSPHQLLLVSPPKLNIEDPFPDRFFHRRAPLKLSIVDGREGHVEAILPATRGTSSGLYRINADRIAAHEHVSEEARNFTQSLRSKYPDMEWKDAYRHVWNAFETAGATEATWKRLSQDRSGKDDLGQRWSLSVAMRLFKNASPSGQRKIHAEPAYTEPETPASMAYGQLMQAVENAPNGKHLFIVPTGVGKTELITRHVVKNEHTKFVILTTNHERCDELRDRLEDARDDAMIRYETWEDFPTMEEQRESNLFRSWAVWRGRLRLCERPEDVKRVQGAHLNVAENLCATCPMYDACGYITQVQSTWRHNWIAPVSMVTNNVRILNEADTIIIDEGVVDQLIGGRHFDLSELRVPRGGARLMELSLKAEGHLVRDQDALTTDELEEALELERSLHPAVHADGKMTPEEIEKSTNMDGFHPNLVSLWRAMAAGPNAVHVYQRTEDVDGQTVVRDICRTAYRKSAQIKDKNVIVFDATPNETALRAHFPDVEVQQFEAKVQNVHVTQVIDSRGNKGEFLNTVPQPEDGKKSSSWKTLEKKKRDKRDKLIAWLKVQPGKSVVICKKELRTHLEAYGLKNVAFGHHGAIEGQDVWDFEGEMVKGAEIDNLMIIGRNLPPPWEAEHIARQHHCDDPEEILVCKSKDGRMPWYDDDYKEIVTGTAGIVPVHADPRVNAVIQNIWKHGLEQAFGRGRGARREKRLRVFIFHNMPVDVTVHSGIIKPQLNVTVGDVALLSPKEVERVFGYSGRFIREHKIEPTHKYWTTDGQTKAFLASVAVDVDAEDQLRRIGAIRVAPR